jgi:hypothetical protein
MIPISVKNLSAIVAAALYHLMNITCMNNHDVIVYALAQIQSFCKDNQSMFEAQGIWWLAIILGLEKRFNNLY